VYPERPAPPPRERGSSRRGFKAFLVLLVAICLAGWPYYSLPMAQRVRSPLHPWLKSSGYVGQSAGLVALAIFLFLWLYPLRKKFRSLAFTGTIARWLDVHVLAALALPLLVAIHAAWRFEGLIGLGFWCMMVVWFSGVAGRYIYARIPRSKLGVELTIEEIVTRRKELLGEIARSSGLDVHLVETTLAAGQAPAGPRGVWTTWWRMIADDLARRRAARALRRLWETRGPRRRKNDRGMLRAMQRLARREMALAQQARMLDATHDVFRYWHVLHRPVAVAALIAILVHVAVVVAIGATWLW
jgi:dihydropyrimidine dehydrogenase (NAD+) subunit PreT